MALDQERRKRLIDKIRQQGLPSASDPLPVVSLEDFFIGNDDVGSIGCNLGEHPGTARFFELFNGIREREEVQDLLVEISEVEEADEQMWPFSERVYVLTSATEEQVADWVAELEPDEVAEGFAFGVPAAAPGLEPGMRVISVWWD